MRFCEGERFGGFCVLPGGDQCESTIKRDFGRGEFVGGDFGKRGERIGCAATFEFGEGERNGESRVCGVALSERSGLE